MDGYGIGQKKKITNSVPIPHDKITVWYWYYNHRLGYARGHHRPHRPRARFYTSDGDWDVVVSTIMGKLYNTALSWGEVVNAPPMDFYSDAESVVLRHNVATELLPAHFKECDVMFCDAPWCTGQKIFNERAGVVVTHDEVAEGIAQIINSYSDILIILTAGMSVIKKLPEPVRLIDTELNGDRVNLAWWNGEYTGPTDKVESIHQHLGETYSTMGDFFCGYGNSIFNFLAAGGQRFVASDYDSNCVGLVAKRLRGDI